MLPLPWGWAVAPTPSASSLKVPEAAPHSFALERKGGVGFRALDLTPCTRA